jgi:type VI protein secretion system component Hcp
MTYKLTNAQLASIEHKGTASELVEKLALNFQKMEIDVDVGGSTTTAQFNN